MVNKIIIDATNKIIEYVANEIVRSNSELEDSLDQNKETNFDQVEER